MSKRDRLTQLAENDALELAADFRTISSHEFDDKTNGAWHKAAVEVGVDVRDPGLHDHYHGILISECVRLSDNLSSDATVQPEDVASTQRDEQTCYFCGRTVATDRAIEEGWVPDFWFNEEESANSPACPECAAEHLTDFDNDPIMKDPRARF